MFRMKKKFKPHTHFCPSCEENWDCHNDGDCGRQLCEHSDDLYCYSCIVFGVRKIPIVISIELEEKDCEGEPHRLGVN